MRMRDTPGFGRRHGLAWSALGLREGDRVAIMGSGGKTTLLRRLAQDARGDVILTTTTHMAPPGHPQDPPFVAFRSIEQFRLDWERLPAPRRILTGRFAEGDSKLRGLLPEEVDGLAEMPGLALLAVEVDGSRTLPAKAHASHEPVFFPRSTVGVSVLGMQALGRCVREGEVHRPALMIQRFGWRSGHRLVLEDLERIAGAYLALLPPGRRILVLSQARSVSEDLLRDLASRFRDRVDRVLGQSEDGLEVLG
jgi:probable selenium-dependent hydroxylase accessory protein YqeC